MKKLIKTIEGVECEIFAVKNHQRHFIGNATPAIEIYQNITNVNVLGSSSSRCKTYEFSVIICYDSELNSGISPEHLKDVVHFDLKMHLKRKDGVFAPFEFRGLTDFDIETQSDWVFNINDYELTKKLIAF